MQAPLCLLPAQQGGDQRQGKEGHALPWRALQLQLAEGRAAGVPKPRSPAQGSAVTKQRLPLLPPLRRRLLAHAAAAWPVAAALVHPALVLDPSQHSSSSSSRCPQLAQLLLGQTQELEPAGLVLGLVVVRVLAASRSMWPSAGVTGCWGDALGHLS